MSTVPGDQSWRDAGLTRPETTDLPEIDPDGRRTDDDQLTDDGDDPAEGGYVPADPRPDLDGRADPADVADQRAIVPEDEGEAYRG